MSEHRIHPADSRPYTNNNQIRPLPDEYDFGNGLGFDCIKARKPRTLPPKVEDAREENWIDRSSVQPYVIAFLCLFCGAMLTLPIVAFTSQLLTHT
jgi:hypothetical protein